MGVGGVDPNKGPNTFNDVGGTAGPDGTTNDKKVGGNRKDWNINDDYNFYSDDTSGAGQPQLPPPLVNPGEIMIVLIKLQDKLMSERVRTGKETIEQEKTEMQKLHNERIKKLKEYWDKMMEADSKSTGFFGHLFKCFKKLFKGDIKGALNELKEGFKNAPFTGALFVLAVLATAALTVAMGPMGLIIGLVGTAMLLGPQALSDPAVQKMLADVTGASLDTIQKWCMGISIALTVLTVIVVAVVTLGTGAGLSAFVALNCATTLISSGLLMERSITQYQASNLRSEGVKASAEADKLEADYEKLQGLMKRNMDYMKEVMENLAESMQRAMETLVNQGHLQFSVASI